MSAVENLEATVKAFDWIINHLNMHDFSEENLPDEVVAAVDLLTDEFKEQRNNVAGQLDAYKLALRTTLRRPL